MNFDGYADARLLNEPGGGYGTANAHYSIWLFDPRKQSFTYNQGLSNLPNPEPNPQAKRIETFERDDVSSYVKRRYSFDRSKLTVEQEIRWAWLDDKEMFRKTVRERRGGRLTLVSEKLTKDVD